MSTTWASAATYSGLTGAEAAYNGTPTKVQPADYANGWAPGVVLSAQELNWIINEVQAEVAAANAALVPSSRTLTAGNGLSGGGDLSADRTFTAVAADASIVVSGSGIAVGVLQSDAMHGNLGRTTTMHADGTAATAGFFSSTAKGRHDTMVAESAAAPWTVLESSVSGSQNNFNPTNWQTADMVVFTAAATITLTGLAAPTGTGAKQIKYLVQVGGLGSNKLVLSHDSGSSTAANRIYVDTNNDSGVSGDYTGYCLAYDTTDSRWVVQSTHHTAVS